MSGHVIVVDGRVRQVFHTCDHPGCKAEINGMLKGGWAIHWTHVRRGSRVLSSRRFDYCPKHAAPYRDRASVVLEDVSVERT